MTVNPGAEGCDGRGGMALPAAARGARLSFLRIVLFWRRPSLAGPDRTPIPVSALSERLKRDVGLSLSAHSPSAAAGRRASGQCTLRRDPQS